MVTLSPGPRTWLIHCVLATGFLLVLMIPLLWLVPRPPTRLGPGVNIPFKDRPAIQNLMVKVDEMQDSSNSPLVKYG